MSGLVLASPTGKARAGRWRRRVKVAAAAMLALWLVMWLAGAQPPQSGPMLQQVTATSATIVRIDRVPTRIRVTLRPEPVNPGEPAHVVCDGDATQHHRVSFTGLTPRTRYAFSIVDLAPDGRSTREEGGSFRTAPVDGNGRIRVVAVGDTGRLPWWTRHFADLGVPRLRSWLEPLGGLGPQWQLAQRLEHERPDFFLHLGDVVYPRGQIEGYEDGFFRPFDRVLRTTPVFAVVGNHDMMTAQGSAFDTVFAATPAACAPRYYTFAWGALRVVVLDPVNESVAVHSRQGRFLEATLAAATERWRIVAMHYPVFCSARYSDDPSLFRNLWPVFARHGIDVVISGHSHDYQRFATQSGIVQVIAGGGGHSIHPVRSDHRHVAASNEYGYFLLDVEGNQLVGEAWTREGARVDRFTLQK